MKSKTTAVLLAALFGPLGVIYASFGWAILTFIGCPVIFVVALGLLDGSALALPVAFGVPWIMCMWIAANCVDSHNDDLRQMIREEARREADR